MLQPVPEKKSLGNGHRKRNPNPRWSKFRSLSKWALRKEACDDDRGFFSLRWYSSSKCWKETLRSQKETCDDHRGFFNLQCLSSSKCWKETYEVSKRDVWWSLRISKCDDHRGSKSVFSNEPFEKIYFSDEPFQKRPVMIIEDFEFHSDDRFKSHFFGNRLYQTQNKKIIKERVFRMNNCSVSTLAGS